jgi:NAD(P)-dependent dehydrogenase (short-subunit alcohol dehydrogenase family)
MKITPRTILLNITCYNQKNIGIINRYNMEKLLNKKTAIITGAASGVGKSIAVLFAKHGAKIALTDIEEDNGKKVADEIVKSGGDTFFFKSDSSVSKEANKAVKKTIDRYGQLDIAVNSAGFGGDSDRLNQYSVELWDKTMGVNLSAIFYGMKHQIPAMLESNGGTVINIASIIGQVGFSTYSTYAAIKHGVAGLTKTAALEYAKKGIKVNAIEPRFIQSSLPEGVQQDQTKQLHPESRLGTADEVAKIALWLASDKSSFVNGANIQLMAF